MRHFGSDNLKARHMRRHFTAALGRPTKDNFDHVHITGPLSGELSESDVQIVSVGKHLVTEIINL